MSESKKPITRTRQEVKNIDIDESKYVKKEDQYAYGINTFTTENDTLTAMEIVSKDKGTTANVKVPSSLWDTSTSWNSGVNAPTKLYLTHNESYSTYLCLSSGSNTYEWSMICYAKNNSKLKVGISFYGGEYNYGCKIYCGSDKSTYLLYDTTSNMDDYILTCNTLRCYQHTLNISKGNEFEGLIIKFTEKSTVYKYSPTTITTPTLFISNINYIKDVVGFILKEGVVTPYVFTYKDDTLYLNGTEIDVNSLTITDDVVTL